jgi:hypothetical protein
MTFDLRDLMLEAQAEVTEILQEITQEILEPQMVQALRLRWGTMPDEAKELLKKQQPETYNRLMQMIEG